MKFLVKDNKKDKKKDKKNLTKKYITTEYDLQKQMEQSEYTRTIIDVFQNLQATGDPSWLKLLPENFLKR